MAKIFSYLLFIVLGFSQTMVVAQKQGNIWYFGNKAGIDFNSGKPVALTDGALQTEEGCAAIADQEGNLLFYTDGVTVWNRLHEVMMNGTNLYGDESATQSGVIVPNLSNPYLYYVFTVDNEAREHGLQFSVVDISKNDGLGEVTIKNQPLLQPATEKVTATLHKNKKDTWVVAHNWESDQFYAYLFSENGMSRLNISNAGSYHGGISENINSAGYMKLSPDGTRLALAAPQGYYGENSFVEVFDFDNATGMVSNPMKVTGFRDFSAYGVEFSPDGKRLYVTDAGLFGSRDEQGIYQFDLTATSETAFQNSRIEIATVASLTGIQLATDGKIYVSRDKSQFLGVIDQPNVRGTDCQYKTEGVFLNDRLAAYGLPNFVQSYFLQINFSAENLCLGDETTFTLDDDLPEGSFSWSFGDPDSQENNTSIERSPTHTFTSAGDYDIELTFTDLNGEVSTGVQEITIWPLPEANLGNDTTLNHGQTLTLSPEEGHSYVWQDGSTNDSFTVSEPGAYSVAVTSERGCFTTDTILVNYIQDIAFDLGNDTTLCPGETLILDASEEDVTYQWQDGSTEATYEVTSSGIYWVDVTDSYGNTTIRDSIEITYTVFEPIVVQDTAVCIGSPVSLQATGANDGQQYAWYEEENSNTPMEVNSGTLDIPPISEEITYYVALTNENCEGERVPITVSPVLAEVDIVADKTLLRPGGFAQLQASEALHYQWTPSEGLSNDTIAQPLASPNVTTIYTVTITTAEGCTATADIEIIVQDGIFIPNTITPNGDGDNETWVVENIENYPDNTVSIYDRAGSLLFRMTNYDQSWNGTYQGKALPENTYFYVIERQNGQPSLKGTLSIIR